MKKQNNHKKKRKPQIKTGEFEGNALRIGDLEIQSSNECLDMLIDRMVWLLMQEPVLSYLDIIAKKKILPVNMGIG